MIIYDSYSESLFERGNLIELRIRWPFLSLFLTKNDPCFIKFSLHGKLPGANRSYGSKIKESKTNK